MPPDQHFFGMTQRRLRLVVMISQMKNHAPECSAGVDDELVSSCLGRARGLCGEAPGIVEIGVEATETGEEERDATQALVARTRWRSRDRAELPRRSRAGARIHRMPRDRRAACPAAANGRLVRGRSRDPGSPR